MTGTIGRKQNAPIGIFDSGLGGLTVFREVRRRLPGENIIYFADTARLPYGSKTPESIVSFSKEITGYMEKRGVKMIVIACNTASALAYAAVKKSAGVPVVDILRPSVKSAAGKGAGKIAVIGTEATISSHRYARRIAAVEKRKIRVVEAACPLFVPLIEEGWVNKKIAGMIADEYLRGFRKGGFETMILGCTHYPLIMRQIKKVLGPGVRVVDSAKAVAEKVEEVLRKREMLNSSGRKGKEEFVVSSAPHRFRDFSKKLLGLSISLPSVKRF